MSEFGSFFKSDTPFATSTASVNIPREKTLPEKLIRKTHIIKNNSRILKLYIYIYKSKNNEYSNDKVYCMGPT